ncbi:hypothetical protein R1sor_014057 [Riccia sorocarpa]|uniref:Uncharacterized protein n=1 Tax=Riccia sorocarpa TaxID=122646 RepID=A0ABD3H8G8_9MARC
MVLRYFSEFSGGQISDLINKSNSELKEIFGRFANFLFMKKEQTGVPGAGALLLDMIMMKGTKIGKPTRYSLFVHHDSWMKCVLHAMGSSFILNQETSKKDDYSYPDIPRGEKVSSYINGVLRDFTGLMKGRANLTSHSGRHGAAAEADCNQTVNVTWIIERCEWVLDRINIAFEYIFGNSRNDNRVARVLAGWPESSVGGLPPLLQDLDHPTLPATLSSLVEDLFSQTLPLALKEMLLAVQLYRFEDVYQYNPNHILVSTIAEHAATYGLFVADLISIGQKLFTSFQRCNLGQLSVEESPDNISGRLTRLTEVQLEVRVELNQ